MDAFKETMEGYKGKFKERRKDIPMGKCDVCGKETELRTPSFLAHGAAWICDSAICMLIAAFRHNPYSGMEEVGVPYAYRGCVVEKATCDLSPTPTITQGPPGMLFVGLPGRGKTWYAAAYLHMVLKAGHYTTVKTRWINASWFCWKLRDAIKNGHEYQALQSLLKPECLVLDDLGSEQQTEYIRGAYYTVIDHRQQAGKFTLITTNHTQAERHDQDATLASRLGAFTVVKFTGPDLRLGESK